MTVCAVATIAGGAIGDPGAQALRGIPHRRPSRRFAFARAWRATRRGELGPATESGREDSMIFAIAFLLLMAWFIGMATSFTLGGWIHALLVLALVGVVFRLSQARRVA